MRQTSSFDKQTATDYLPKISFCVMVRQCALHPRAARQIHEDERIPEAQAAFTVRARCPHVPQEKSPDTTVPLAAALNAGNPTAEDWIPIHSPVPGKLQTPGNSETEQSNHALKVEPSKPGTNVNLQHTTAASAIRDAETWAVVHSPPGGEGRAVVVYEDGLTVTRHADGTVQRWWRGEGKAGTGAAELVLVECAGFASVEVRTAARQRKIIGVLMKRDGSTQEPEYWYTVVGIAGKCDPQWQLCF